MEDGLYWQAKLQPLGVPLPRLYHNGEIEGYPFAIYQRLPGADLEAVYPGLSPGTRRRIARRVAEIQQKIHTLDDWRLRAAPPWLEMVQRILNRSEREIGQQGWNDLGYVDLVRQRLGRHETYLAAIRAVGFYSNVLGFANRSSDPALGDHDANPLNLFVIEDDEIGGLVMELFVKDLEDAREELLAHGCQVIRWRGKGQDCYIRDPFGVIFNLWEKPGIE